MNQDGKTALRFGPSDVVLERAPDGVLKLRARHSLGAYPRSLTDSLDHWAAATPERTFLAQRSAAGPWRKLSYAEVRASARSIAEALLARELSPERPVAILSGNSIAHALVGLGAMYAGVPYAPISPPYSLIAKDFGKLNAILALLTPGLVFVDDGKAFAAAIEGAIPREAELVVVENPPSTRPATLLSALLATPASRKVEAANARVTPDTIAKILFTSGSTGAPKGVINTQHMMTSNQAMAASSFPSFVAPPPVLLDWLPWSHTFGGNHNFNLALTNGGTFYIDEGKPVPRAIEETVRNLREVSPTVYFNVPKGYEMLLPYLKADKALRETMLRNLQCFFYAGAGLPGHVWEEYDRLSMETVGARVPMLTSLGSTETGPSALNVTDKARSPGVIGLPNAGVELKLVPNAGKLEARLKSPSVTPGYWRQPTQTKAAFDEEGYYLLGDALRFADPNDPEKGFYFDGRVAEDFKLATGTWVSVGPLRAKFVAHFAPFARDLVIAGQDRDDATALVVPDLDACRELGGFGPKDASPESILANPAVRAKFSALLASFNKAAGGSSGRIARMIPLVEAPSLDTGEMTDKGSINQRAVLKRRDDLVAALYAEPPSSLVIS